jgi:tetratricopeptide (TPR) repeat protein
MIGVSQLVNSELTRRYALDAAVEWQRLLTHLEWRQGFAFIVLLVPDKYGAEICRLSLETYLATSDKTLWTIRYSEPAELKTLTAQLMELEPPADTGAIWVEAVIPEAVKEYESWRDAWRVAVAVLNRYRNPLVRRFSVPLMFVGAPWLQVLLRDIAPDLWSVRTLVVRVEPEVVIEREPVEMIEPEGDEFAPDPEFALQVAAPLRNRAGQELQLATILHRAGKGFIARFEWKRAEEVLSESVQLRKQFAPTSEPLAEAIYDLAKSFRRQYEYEKAIGSLHEASGIYRQIGHLLGEANCLQMLGDMAFYRSDRKAARACYEESLNLNQRIGNMSGQAECIARLGDVALLDVDHKTAQTRYEEALLLYRRSRNVLGEATCIWRLGDIAYFYTDYTTARAHYEQAISLYRLSGSIRGEANCIQRLGKIALKRSEYESAVSHFEEALRLYRQIGDVAGEANCFTRLADAALNLSDQAKAKEYFETALKLYQQVENNHSLASVHRRLARLAVEETERKQHIQAALTLWERIDRPDLIRELEEEFNTGS